MKKNISINIGGIIFHIEEDGYDKLKSYLESINKYFSAFEDSKEIVDDIENRIAELLLGKLTDGKQVVTPDDIEDLISTMGTVADFEATIEVEEEDLREGHKEQKQEEDANEKEEQAESETKKRLYRNTKRRVIGGVASGMAHYFSVDPIWIRLLLLALFFNIFFWGVSGATLLAYIILWIVLPGNDHLEEDKKVKKLYRDTEDRVLGGVSSGIAAYFGTDRTVIRLLFVLSIFLGGAGILLYIILWIITPEAKTITEKMQMQGEPVTLSNIEENVKKSFNVKEGEENVFVKILLFPFRLIALIINGLADILGPLLKFLVEALRILFGVLVIITGFSLMFSFLVSLAFLLGIGTGWSTNFIYMDDPTINLFIDVIDPLGAIGFFLLTFIPALALTLLGIIIIAKRKVGNAYMGWSLFGLWVIGLIISAFYIPSLAKDFRADTDIREELIFEKPSGVPTLKLNDDVPYDDYDGINLRLRGHEDSLYKLVLRIESRGYDRSEARKNAEEIDYHVNKIGNDFVFDSDIDFNKAPFRFQEVHAIFYIPFGEVFKMDRELSEILRSTLHLDGYRTYQMEGNEWVFDRSGLKCLTCDEDSNDQRRTRSFEESSRDEEKFDRDRVRGERSVFEFEDFDEITVNSMIDIKIIKDDEFIVELYGENEEMEDVFVSQRGDELKIEFKNDWEWFERREWDDNKVTAFVHLPKLESLELIGGCNGELTGFNDDEIEINLTGASDLFADISPEYLDVNLTGASSLRLFGEAERLDAKIIGASRISAFEFYANEVILEVLGASKASVYARDEMEINAAGASTVRYKGTDRVSVESVGFSNVRRD